MKLQRDLTRRLTKRASAALVLFLLLNVFTPILATAASLFNLQFDPVTGKVHGFIYSDKPSLSVSVNDATYGTKTVVSNMNFTKTFNNGYYYDLNELGSSELKGLKPVTAVVYEGSTPVYSTKNNVTGDVYSYNSGNNPNLRAPTGLVATFDHGYWRINWDSLNQTFQSGIREYRNGKLTGESCCGGFWNNEWRTPYYFNQPPIDLQLSTVDVLGNESPLSEKVTLQSAVEPDGYHYQGRVFLNGISVKGTKFDVKNASGVIVESFTYNDQAIKGQSDLGRYWINYNSPGFAGKFLEYYFDLPGKDYSITVTNIENMIFQPKLYPTDFAAYVEYDGKFANVVHSEIFMFGHFKTIPTFFFNNKEAGHWFGPNEEIAKFTPSRGEGNFLNIQFPHDIWPVNGLGAHNVTSIQRENLSVSDFQLIKVSDQSVVGIQNWYSGDILLRQGILALMLDKGLEPNEQYVLKMSPTSGANEIRLPLWSGDKFSASISTTADNHNNYLLDQYVYDGTLIDTFLEQQTVKITSTSVANANAAAAVTAKITALPAAASVTLANETAVNEAKTAFDQLTTAQKALVITVNQTKLADALAKIAELKAAPRAPGGGGFIDNSPKPTEDGVKLDSGSLNVTKEAGSDGKQVSRVKLDAEALSKALDAVKSKDKDHQTISVEVIGTEAGAKIDIPAASLVDAIKSNSDIIISIQSDTGSYQVPVSIFKDLTGKLNADLKDVKVTISVTQASEKSYQALQQANPSVKTLIANPIEFTITAETGSGKVEINDFSGTYVERKIIVPSIVDGDKSTVVSFDPITGKMSFIPAVVTHINGKTEITIKSPHNSMYTLVKLSKAFSDISTHWAKADIEMLASKFVVQGMNETTFAPDQHVTRAQFAAMLVSSLALNTDSKSVVFRDVKAEDWFSDAVNTAAKLGLVEGNSAEEFAPNANISREQMAMMISRALKLSGKAVQSTTSQEKLSRFTDSNAISNWAKSAVAQTIEANIVNGLTDQSFSPKENATRAQATVMLKRFLQYVQFIN
ncbi:S-layer homology domain-containing protein [Paenibacillus andongensis]|uniref:S-layer homology domain-containing protein n=1 Tax=Paenibacillus andongensis TaxID=2975482 RepID=UPI0021BB96B6|nr:S-layer homology domain-containing protein [Paenibacillus andongensis]